MAATTLTPSFHLKFGHAIIPGKVVVGRFDGRHPSLAAATTGGRVLLHTPFEFGEEAGASRQAVRFLNINRDITTLASGQLLPSLSRDLLLVGTASSFQAYDVDANRDVIFRDVPDAVTAAAVGAWSPGGEPLAFVGGNCSIQGYDGEGKDVYWTVAGDVVSCAVFGDLDGDGRPELLVGCDDFDIQAYRGEDAIREVTETDKVVALLLLPGSGSGSGCRFAYALVNGTVGVYNGSTFVRAWRAKGRSRVVSLAAFDIDGDGTAELTVGYADGRFEARRVSDGTVLYRDAVSGGIAAVVSCDYRGDGKETLLVVSCDGEVRGYAPTDAETLAAIRTAAGALTATTVAAAGSAAGAGASSAAATAAAAAVPVGKGGKAAAAAAAAAAGAADIAALIQERAKLAAELHALELSNAGYGKGGSGSGVGGAGRSGAGAGSPFVSSPMSAAALPASTDVTVALALAPSLRHLELVAHVRPGASSSASGAGAGMGMGLGMGVDDGSGSWPPPYLRSVTVYALDAGVLGTGKESIVAVAPSAGHGPGGAGSAAGGMGMGMDDLAAGGYPGAAMGATGQGSCDRLAVPLAPPANVATELRVQAVVGAHHSASHCAVIEKRFPLPKFAMLQPLARLPPAALAGVPAPRGHVTFPLRERAQRVAMWLQSAFGLPPDAVPVAAAMATPALDARFLHVRTGRALALSVAAEHGGSLVIACDDMALAGELIQDLAAHLSLSEVASQADFPDDIAAFRRTLASLAEHSALRARLTGDSAASSGEVKALIVQAEDARLLGDMPSLRRCFGELRGLHGQLVGEYARRAANHAALVADLKEVNQMIQRAANLRVGDARSRVIAACRAAIKSGSHAAMVDIITRGA